MTSREMFSVGVRVVGLLQLMKALDYLLQAFDISAGLYKTSSIGMGACYSHVFVYFGLGLYLLAGAPQLVQKIYNRDGGQSVPRDSDAKM